VAVFLKKTLAELDHDKQARRASQLEPDREQDELLLQRAHFLGEVCRFKKIAVLSEGAPFGELGILYNKPRIALIVARTTCRVAVMAREHYINIFCEAENQERKLKREFIFAHFFAKFRDLKYELSEALLYSFKERKYKINETICHQHDPFAGFFLLKSGELLLSRSNANNANQLISIVSQGHLLCYEEWRASVESGQPARIHFTARVTSAEARVYFLSLEEMRKIYNIDSLVRDVTPNLSYAQCLEPTPNPIPMPPTQIQPEQPSASKRAGDVRKLRELEKNMQDAVLASLLTVDKRK
jgi:CRP-like cAMP-binding protein